MLSQLVYVSTRKANCTSEEIEKILRSCQVNNASGNDSLTFKNITLAFLKGYEQHLLVIYNNMPSTIVANFKLLRTIYNNAINEDLVEAAGNPFRKHRLRSNAAQREYLTEEEIKRIEELPLDQQSMRFHHRNLYIFCAYAGGMRISDVLKLRWKNINDGRINLMVQKTGKPLHIKLPNPALRILDIYKVRYVNAEEYVFPLLRTSLDCSDPRKLLNAISAATTYTNKDLKEIARLAGINKRISFHTSRHTFATLGLRKGIPIEYVSKLLGHSTIRETQGYAKIVSEELDKAMDRFNN